MQRRRQYSVANLAPGLPHVATTRNHVLAAALSPQAGAPGDTTDRGNGSKRPPPGDMAAGAHSTAAVRIELNTYLEHG